MPFGIKRIFTDRRGAITKKSMIIMGVAGSIVLAFLVFIFGGGSNFLGLLIGVAIFAAITVGVYFLLRIVGDLPDPF